MELKNTSQLQLTSEFWNILYKSVPSLFNNTEETVHQLGIIIDKCKVHYDYYVPNYIGQREQYESNMSHYIEFTPWLICQLVRATTLDSLVQYHQQIVSWQVNIVAMLAIRNQHMFVIIMYHYLTAIKDVKEAREKFQDNTEKSLQFKWFTQPSPDSQHSLPPVTVENSSQSSALVVNLLRVVQSQTRTLSYCSPLAMEQYWSHLLELLEDNHIPVVTAVVDCVTAIIVTSEFPHYNIQGAHRLCLIFGDITQVVSNKYSGNCDGVEQIKHLMIAVSKFFRSVLTCDGTGLQVNDICLFQTLLSLLHVKNPFLYSGCTSRDYFKTLSLYLKKFGASVEIKTKIQLLLCHGSHCPGIFYVVETLVLQDIDQCKPHESGTDCSREVKAMSSVWEGVLVMSNQAMALLNSKSVLPATLQRELHTITAVLQSAHNISLQVTLTNSTLVFFGSDFYKNFNSLILEVDLTLTNHELIVATNHLVSLQEASVVNLKEVHKLLVFLSVPWLKNVFSAEPPCLDLTRYIMMANLHLCSEDVSTQLVCVEGLMSVCSRVVADCQSWWIRVLQQAHRRTDTTVALLRMLPVLVTKAPSVAEVVFPHLLAPLYNSNNRTVLIHLAQSVPLVVCALAGTTSITRNNSSELYACCKICDDKSDVQSAYMDNAKEQLLIPVLEQYLVLQESEYIQIRKIVGMSLKNWMKHVKEATLWKYLRKWLMKMNDPEDELGICFTTVSRHVVSSSCSTEFLTLLCDITMEATQASLLKANGKLQISLMTLACSIGCQLMDSLLWRIVKTFLVFLANPLSLHPTVAQNCLAKIAESRNKTPQEIFFKFQDEIFKVIASLLFHNHRLSVKSVTEALLRLSRGLGFLSVKDLLDTSAHKYLLKYLLPLVVKVPSARDLLSLIAVKAAMHLPTLLNNSFQFVYPHLCLFEDKDVAQRVCDIVVELTVLPLCSLIRFSFKVITCELVLYFHVEKAKVTEALLQLKKHDLDKLPSNSLDSPNDIAQYIQPRFLAILAYLDSILVSRSGCDSTKRKVLLALPDLINLMGPDRINPVRFKVLATLRSALNLYHSDYPDLICSAWRSFIHNVTTIGPLLSTIFVSLLPLLDEYPVEVSSVFQTLVINHQGSLSGYLAELHFLPDTPATHQIYTLVQQELAQLRESPVKDQLTALLHMASHENSDVQLHGLRRLYSDLCLHRQQVSKLIVNNDTLDPFILKLLEALISGCRDSEESIRLASCQCLGEIGALDPGQIPNTINTEGIEKVMLYTINSGEFVERALNKFVRALQAANHSTTMDTFAFGIQELLKLYKVDETGIWNRLPEAIKEIIAPFLESRYKDLAKDTESQGLNQHPIFGSILGVSFKSWAVNWLCRLISSVTDEFVRDVFSVCQLGMKKDLQILTFFLPYIVLYAILGATKHQSRRIGEEISAVLFNDSLVSESDSVIKNSTIHSQCAKTVYQVFDCLYRWLRQTKQLIKPNEQSELFFQYQTLGEFLKSFSKLEIAMGSYNCKEYTRALLFLEEYLSENPNAVQDHLSTLGKIYYNLNDADGFRGVIAIYETEPTAQEMILYHQVTGKLQDAAACYERIGQENIAKGDLHRTMVQCYLSLDQPYTALQVAKGLLDSMNASDKLLDERAVAMLSLSMFPELETLLKSGHEGWGVSLGQALLHLSKREGSLMTARLDSIRATLVRSLSNCSVSQSGYRHDYDTIVKLHIIAEVEKLGNMVLKMVNCKSTESLLLLFKDVVTDELDNRLKVVQPSCRVLQQVLCVRRVVLALAQQILDDTRPDILPYFSAEIGKSWLKSIEIARKSGHYQQAYTNILTVEPYKPKGLFIEKAKLLWAKSEPESALRTLKRGIDYYFPNCSQFKIMSPHERVDDRKLCAEAKLLVAIYNDESVNVDMETNLANYSSAVEVCRNWEKSTVCLAQYYYKYLRTLTDNPETLKQTLEYQLHMINYFGKSLEFGCEYIYQSLPRMLSCWLDYGTKLAQELLSVKAGTRVDKQSKKSLEDKTVAMDKMTTLVKSFIDRLPIYMFMTAFSQIISRICHPHKECYKTLKAVIIKIIIAYPQQSLWMFLSVYKSPYTVRVRRCEEVLNSSEIQKDSSLCRTINAFKDLFNQLIVLSNKEPPKLRGSVSIVSIKTFQGGLHRLLSNSLFSRVVIPLQKFRTVSLPRSPVKYHNPFPEDMVYICGIRDEIAILPSLQRPKKITFIGTDGKEYPMMCKPADDLRLDSRMMEFNSIVNMYLQRDADARECNLHIRTYSAVPLNDTSGLIEWVPNLIGLRYIINTIYKQMGILIPLKGYNNICCARNDPLTKKRQVFLEELLPRHPAVLREWFMREFSQPTTWYLARTGYVRTLAVMSIVGYMLGLGDRHGENILLDSTCGNVVHVDFNCLFNKGERFEWPERVPFRLTHNLVDAMGPTGVEGVFRHSCEITTRVMRQQIDQLMSVVRPFCYDPLVSWNTGREARDENAEMTNEKAMEDIQNIESRLRGFVAMRKRTQACPLSVEGQVGTLIGDATNIDNLCQMYIGWGPYL